MNRSSQSRSPRAHLLSALRLALLVFLALLPGMLLAPMPVWLKISVLSVSFAAIFSITFELTRPRVMVENQP